MAANQPHFASASLYVGDLDPDVNETMLFEVFNAIGPVASIRVCRESGSRKSLGYAYVNYHSINDAERSLDTLNYTPIKGVPCRIMWSHRDPSLRKSGAGNIFVKNLDKIIDNKALYDTFSLFGNILSCKVATDEYGKSRGYGFVHYETEESGKTAIEKVNGMQIGSKTVYVGPFKRRMERTDGRGVLFTNIYVKQFPAEWNEDTLRSVFAPFGEVTSLVISTDNKKRRFGFVNFENPESARAAVESLHGKRTTLEGIQKESNIEENTLKVVSEPSQIDNNEGNGQAIPTAQNPNEAKTVKNASEKEGNDASASEEKDEPISTQTSESKTVTSEGLPEDRLYVQRAMSKTERISILKETFNHTNETKQKQLGVNLYVKNLDDQVTDEAVREVFSKFGTVTSAKIMRDEAGVSKGFGFVCFAFPEEATKAVTAMHLKIFQGKPLYVGLAEKRDHRIARLQQRYRMSNVPSARPQTLPMMIGQSGVAPQMIQYGGTAPQMYYGGQLPTQQGPGGRPLGSTPGISGYTGASATNMAWRQQGPRPYGASPGASIPPQMTPSYPTYPIGPNAVAPMNVMGPGSVPMRTGGVGSRTRGGVPGGPSMGQNFKFTPQARNRQDLPHVQQAPIMASQPHMVAGDSVHIGSASDIPLSAQTLATAHPQMQKQILGERLFPLVHKHQPELAGKITGMMLEMDNAELLSLLESEVQLQAKVDEALGVLHRHHQGGVAPSLGQAGPVGGPANISVVPGHVGSTGTASLQQ